MLVWVTWLVGLTLATLAGAWFVRKYRDSFGYPVLVAIYTSFIVVCNLLTSRLVVSDFGFTTLVLPGATLMFPFIAQVVDMINEVYGRRASYTAVWITFVASTLASVMVWHVASEEPATFLMPDLVYEEAWRYFMLQSPRIVAASYVAFLVANSLDVKVFADLKRYMYRRYREAQRRPSVITMFVLVRSLASDAVNMTVDSLVFMPLAFLGVIPLAALPAATLDLTIAKLLIIAVTQPFLIGYRLLIRDVARVVD